MEKVLLKIEEVLCPNPARGKGGSIWGFLWHLGGVPNLFQSFWSEKKRARKYCQKHITYWGLYLVEDSTFAMHCWTCFKVAGGGAFSFRGIKNSGDRATTLTTRITDLSSQGEPLAGREAAAPSLTCPHREWALRRRGPVWDLNSQPVQKVLFMSSKLRFHFKAQLSWAGLVLALRQPLTVWATWW